MELNLMGKLTESMTEYLAGIADQLLSSKEKEHFSRELIQTMSILGRRSSLLTTPVPRTVVYSNKFKEQIESIEDDKILQKIKILESWFRTGNYLINDPTLPKAKRFVTKNTVGFFDSTGRFIQDFMKEGLGVSHYHVGYNNKTNDFLLYALFQRDIVHFLVLGKHADLYIEAKGNVVFDVLLDEYADWANQHCPILKGVSTETKLPESVNDVKSFKVSGITSFFYDKLGNARMVVNGNSTARTSYRAFKLARGMQDEMFACYENTELYKKGYEGRLLSCEFVDGDAAFIFRIYGSYEYSYAITKIHKESYTASVVGMISNLSSYGMIEWPKYYDEIRKFSDSRNKTKRRARQSINRKNLPPA